MPQSNQLPLRAALALCLAAAIAACGAQADQDKPVPPRAGGAAGGASTGGNGGAAATGKTDAPADDDAQALVQDDDGANDAGDGQDDDWPAIRDVPGGTLTWDVVYTGTGTTRNSEMKEVAQLVRRMHGQAHMTGAAGNPDQAPPPTPLDGINQQMAACGDDMACQRKAAMQAMALARKDPGALERGVREAMAEIHRDTSWGADTCNAVGQADDKATWSGMTPLGFNTGEGTRHGKRVIEDCGGSEAPRLVADDNSKTYALTLPAAEIRVDGELGGRVEPVPPVVEFPQLRIEGIAYSTLDRPLKGSATVHQGRGHGVWSKGWDIALTEKVSWTFTPDTQ